MKILVQKWLNKNAKFTQKKLFFFLGIVVISSSIFFLSSKKTLALIENPGSDIEACTVSVSQPGCYSLRPTPTLQWSFTSLQSAYSALLPASQTNYAIQIATDLGFGNIVYSTGWTAGGGTNYAIPTSANLNWNVSYYWRIRVRDNYGSETDYSPNGTNQFTTSNQCAPAVPSNVQTSPVGCGQMQISWNDNSNNEDGFRVEVSDNGTSGWTLFCNVGAGITSCQAAQAAVTIKYYRVRAYNTQNSAWAPNSSPGQYGSNYSTCVPPAPSNVQTSPVGCGQMRVSWNDNSPNETGFRVEVSDNGTSGWTLFCNVGADITSCQAAQAAVTIKYYRVRSAGAAGSSAWAPNSSPGQSGSNYTQCLPWAPTNISVSYPVCTTAQVNWTDNTPNETQYTVESSPDQSSWNWFCSTGAGTGGMNCSNPQAQNTIMYYRVYASNAIGDSPNSPDDNGATGDNSAVCVPGSFTLDSVTPQECAANPPGGPFMNIDWSPATNADYYLVEYSTDGSTWINNYAPNCDNPIIPPATSCFSIGLAFDTQYWYRVQAWNTTGRTVSDPPPIAATTEKYCRPSNLVNLDYNCKCAELKWEIYGDTTPSVQYEVSRTINFPPDNYTVLGATTTSNTTIYYSNCDITSDISNAKYRVRATSPDVTQYSNEVTITDVCTKLPTWREIK